MARSARSWMLTSFWEFSDGECLDGYFNVYLLRVSTLLQFAFMCFGRGVIGK